MPSLLNAAKYLAKEHGFTPVYTNDPLFDAPLVLASQRNTFDSIHLLSCLANDTDVTYVSTRRVTDWLGEKAYAASGR